MTTLSYTDEQMTFMNTTSPRLILEAPAGSGKTETVAERVRRRVQDGKKVMLVCFTHSAQKTLQKRLDDAGVDLEVRRVVSLAHEIVSEEFGSEMFEIGSGEEIAREVAQRGVASASKIVQLEALIANGAPIPEDFSSIVGEYFDKYTEKKKERNYLSYIDLVLIATGLRTYDLDEIVVDEAQDLTGAQFDLLTSFGSRGLTLVGDSGQAIYGFSGVNPQFFSTLVEQGWDRVELTKSFRVPANILEVVNAPRESPLESMREGGTVITHITEYKKVAQLLENKLKVNDVVIGATSQQLERVASRLEAHTSLPVSRSWKDGVVKGTVQFSTIHASKGGEWERAYLLDIGQHGMWSPQKTKDDEARRLFYVAASRAQSELVLVKTGEKLPWGLE